MFKLESYITPLLMGYLDKYVKLRQEDFQLSLWGGDAVLNNLDLRLDELEKVLQLPVMFQSGHIHELRLHVPWTKLGSEPVVITINTVECILKVRDTAYDGASKSPSKSSLGKSPQAVRSRSKRRSQPGEDLPPGYLQSIVNRIINNVTFIINNLILKFVEDDIVLSVNVKSAECYSVDRDWNRAFVDLTSDDLALRKMLNFADLTVCLDKTNASGHIESYQEPMAYRCAVSCRLHMEYDFVTSKLPSVTRLNLFCDTLNLSLTDTQLPMFIRLIELCIAMYYGTLDIPISATNSTSTEEVSSQDQVELTMEPPEVGAYQGLADQGWASWAWSFVPQILPTEEDETGGVGTGERGGKPSPLVLSIGIYIHQGSIVFKLTEKSKDGTDLPHRKMHFHPFLRLAMDGVGVEVLLQGILFCSIQCGITSLKLTTCGNCICDVADEKIARCNTLLSGGEDLDNKMGLNYISNSLFDSLSWENRGQRAHHVVEGEEHRQVFTEQYALQRFGAFWVDNLYTLESSNSRHGTSSHSSETDGSDSIFQREFSTLRFVFGNTHLQFSSTLYHRVSKFVHCATSHHNQPYGVVKSAEASSPEERPKPTEDQVKSLEEFIPTTLLHIMFINPTVTILQAEHSYCDVAKKNYKYRQKKREAKSIDDSQHSLPIPAIVLSTSRLDLQITRPMYPGRLVRMVTAIAGPSSNLLHHCHSHLQVKLFSLQAGLQRAIGDGTVSGSLTILPPCSFALYQRSLVLPKLWINTSLPLKEWMCEIPNASVNINKASVLMCCRIMSTWVSSMRSQELDHILNDSLLDDLFPASGESTHQNYPLLEIGLSGLEFKSCDSPLVSACVGSLSLLHVFLYSPGIAGKMSVIPILYGPNDTSKVCSPDFFRHPVLDKAELHCDCITATIQRPKHAGVSEAQALALMDCQGFCIWLDPGLINWFHYCPEPRVNHKMEQAVVTLDLSLAQITSPLNAVSQASVHSTSSPSHPGASRQQISTSLPHPGRSASITDMRDREQGGVEKDNLAHMLAQYFPLMRSFHVQLELKPCAIFLPKTGVPNSESSSDILTIVHQARHAGRLSDTLVICLPSMAVTSTMAKPMNVLQDLPVRSIQGSLIGEKLPWSLKVSNMCVYSLMSGQADPVFLIHPLDVMSTLAVTCKYNPPTSEIISTLALCLHVDVGQPTVDITTPQLHLCSTVADMVNNIANNAIKMAKDCTRQFIQKAAHLTPSLNFSQKRSVSSSYKIESIRSVEVTENLTTDISEDFSHEGSPLHENIIDDREEAGVKLSLWLQLMVPRLQCTLYRSCPVTHQENGLSMIFDHFDLSMDSQSVYSKAKVTLGSLSIQHAIKNSRGFWPWTDPEAIVLSFSHQLPASLHMVTNKTWMSDAHHHDTSGKDKKHGVLSVTFTRALCKNVKKRLRRANVDLPSVNELDTGVAENVQSAIRPETLELYYHQYLSEICVKSEPFDVVLKPEVVKLATCLSQSLVKHDKKNMPFTPAAQLDVPSEPVSSLTESAKVHNLPLIYADLGKIRVFLPKSGQPLFDQKHAADNVDQLNKAKPASNRADVQQSKTGVVASGGDLGDTLEGPESNPSSDICSTLSHDFLLVQMNSCLVQPHADNPLPRTSQQKDIYHYAVQSGWTHQPGSVIEDRQYQMDVRGVSFSSGVWEEVIHEMKQVEIRKPPSGSMVQIPALDWNTFLMDSPSQDRKSVQLIPLATPCDFSLVVAPPISYLPQVDCPDLNKQALLISRLSAELNLTSDLDLFISTSQIKLLSDIVGQISLSLEATNTTSSRPSANLVTSPLLIHGNRKETPVSGGGVDSGVESDLSTLTLDRAAQKPPGARMFTNHLSIKMEASADHYAKENSSSLLKSIPLDILVTASRISCSLYNHKILEEKFNFEIPVFSDNQQANRQPVVVKRASSRKLYSAEDNLELMLNGSATSKMSSSSADRIDEPDSFLGETSDDPGVAFSFMKPNSEENIKRVISAGSVCMVPFVYIYITQPHCLVASDSGAEVKVEGSCYDVLIKGASDKHITAIDEFHIIPDCTDYNIHWLETRPGQPHPYTGIPPSLLTIRFISSLSDSGTVSIQIDRPVRLKVSKLAVQQMMDYACYITQMFADGQSGTDTSGHAGGGGGDREETCNVKQHKRDSAVVALAERLKVNTTQVVLALEISESLGAVVSSEGIELDADVTRKQTDNIKNSLSGHLQLKDVVVKTMYKKVTRTFMGPLSFSVDSSLSWIPLQGGHYLPQIFLAVETNMIIVNFGQEHMFCLTDLVQQVQNIIKDILVGQKSGRLFDEQKQDVAPPAANFEFVQDRSQDDLRCGKFHFIDGSESSTNLLPDAYEIIFSSGGEDIGENSCMMWCYPHPRVITAMHLIPVPFYLSASPQSLDSRSKANTVPCLLQYWDEISETFVNVIKFHLSENEPVIVDLPEPRSANKSICVSARMWRVVLLQFSLEDSLTKTTDVAVLPTSLAACMCVDSAFVPSTIPTLQVTVSVPAINLHLCHHLGCNGSADIPGKLALYTMSPDLADQQVFGILRVENLAGSCSYTTAQTPELKLKISLLASLNILEYGNLKMETVLPPAALSLSVDIISDSIKKQEINCFLQCEKFRINIGRSTVHTLNMAIAAWSTFNPDDTGPHVIFSHYIVCNNTASALRFGQAGTDENILLYSREMHAYSWRSYTSPQLMHLCMDKPTWKWTEPFPVDKEGSSVYSVTARDQSYVVIVQVRRLSSLQVQITICGQLIVCNRLSQPINMRFSLGAISSNQNNKFKTPGSTSVQQFVIEPGEHLPGLTSNDIMVNPVQFRLADHSTSWSHEIYLSGDRMKDNQMVKILLPDSSSYFHVWCRIFCQHFYGMPQKLGVYQTATLRMIMLTPLYVVRTHLPCPLFIHMTSPKQQTQEMKVESQGREFQLHCTGGDITHEMAFRLGHDMLLSDPAIKLSTGLIGQLTRIEMTSVDIESLCEQRMNTIHSAWPYLMDEKGLSIDNDIVNQDLNPDNTVVNLTSGVGSDTQEPQPSIDLNIRLSEYIPGCDTLLVEVAPNFLVHNATDLDVMISGAQERRWCIKSGHTVAPPLLKDELKLAIKMQGKVSEEKIVPMSGESQDYRRYNDDIGKVLFIDSYVHVSFQISFENSNLCEMVFITLTSDLKHDIRVICIRERFALTNQTGLNLKVKLLALPLSPDPICMSEKEAVIVTSLALETDSESKQSSLAAFIPQPLLRWASVASGNTAPMGNSGPQDATYVCYLSFAVLDQNIGSFSRVWKWSVPVRLVSSKDGYKATTSIPDVYRMPHSIHETNSSLDAENFALVTHAVCVVTQLVKGVTHLVVSNDPSPACIVENLCPFSLEFGQICDKLMGNGAVIQEQVELVSDLPRLPPGAWAHYTPPCINADFMSRENNSLPRLHFRAMDVQLNGSTSTGTSEWSSGTQITGNMDAFVRLPGFCDLKVMINYIGMVTHLVIRPVSKAEITAKEIRSRIKDQGEEKLAKPDKSRKFGGSLAKWETQSAQTPAPDDKDKQLAQSASSPSTFKLPNTPTYVKFSERCCRSKGSQSVLNVGLLCRSLTIAVQDESNAEILSEFMCVHMKDFFFACYSSTGDSDSSSTTKTSYTISTSSLQVDNQKYGVGAYDFPVVFLPQTKSAESGGGSSQVDLDEAMSIQELHAMLKSNLFAQFQLVTLSDTTWQQSVIESIDILIKPFSLYVDDSFVYGLLQEVESFTPSRLGVAHKEVIPIQGLHRRLPSVVVISSRTLCQPIRIKQLTIQPIKMLLSVHASVKLFLASDHTPLSMGKFEKANVFTTVNRLTNALTMHYASAAIFRAGIVVGSLEILGNPTGLVRSIGTGVSDLVHLSYSGLTRGPAAFLTGLSRGIGSLVRNVSAGMITSVTNFASSVSRNMDRLSFDTTHLARQEESRRNRPLGVSDGLKQGLTGFGLSILGAVAGLADQPLQTLLSADAPDDRRSSATSAATGFVAGVSKGLVGVFTKPIGGAAEFVSQTGQGILHGTGLGQLPSRLEKTLAMKRLDLPDGPYKYCVKMFTQLPAPDLLLAAPAIFFDLLGAEVRVMLLLTPDVLVVVNCQEDAQQQALSISELDCKVDFEETTGRLLLQWMDQLYGSSAMETSNKDRVAAFIDTQIVTDQPPNVKATNQSDIKASSDDQSKTGSSLAVNRVPSTNSLLSVSRSSGNTTFTSPQYEFDLEPHWLDIFVALFRLAKNRLQGRGFPV